MEISSLKSYKIFILLWLNLFAHNLWAEDVNYPYFLSVKEIIDHYDTYKNVNINVAKGPMFTLSIDGNKAARDCPQCNITFDDGRISYNHKKNRICFKWDVVTYPSGGCYSLRKTGPKAFELVKWGTKYGYRIEAPEKEVTTEVVVSKKEPAEGLSIVAHFSGDDLSLERVRTAAIYALGKRGWSIDSFDKTNIILASLVKSNQEFRVILTLSSGSANIEFVGGYGSHRDNWLRNIEKDMVIFLRN